MGIFHEVSSASCLQRQAKHSLKMALGRGHRHRHLAGRRSCYPSLRNVELLMRQSSTAQVSSLATITQTGSGINFATDNKAGSAGTTGTIKSFVSQNTATAVNDTLSATTLGVCHASGGADHLT